MAYLAQRYAESNFRPSHDVTWITSWNSALARNRTHNKSLITKTNGLNDRHFLVRTQYKDAIDSFILVQFLL